MAGGPARFNLGFSCPDLLRILLTPTHFACTGFSPSLTGLSMPFQFFAQSYIAVLQPPSRRNAMGLGCAAFARHYLRYHFCFLFLLLLRCFSSEGSLLIRGTIAGGLPHSDICGSMVICTSPQLFAAYHVLLRLAEPRHPPYALISFLMLAKIASLSREGYSATFRFLISFSDCQVKKRLVFY